MMSANRAHEKQVISEEMLRVILSNIGSLYTINTGLLAELEKRIASWYAFMRTCIYICGILAFVWLPWQPQAPPKVQTTVQPHASSEFCSLAVCTCGIGGLKFFAVIHNPVTVLSLVGGVSSLCAKTEWCICGD